MLIKINGNTYPVKSAGELSLLDLLTLERETRELGRPLSMSVLAGMERSVEEELRKTTTTEERNRVRQEHPESAWLLAVTLWASRRASGEHVTFEEAISFPLATLEFVTEAGDVEDETPDPQPARSGSAAGARPRPKRSGTKTSKPLSTDD